MKYMISEIARNYLQVSQILIIPDDQHSILFADAARRNGGTCVSETTKDGKLKLTLDIPIDEYNRLLAISNVLLICSKAQESHKLDNTHDLAAEHISAWGFFSEACKNSSPPSKDSNTMLLNSLFRAATTKATDVRKEISARMSPLRAR